MAQGFASVTIELPGIGDRPPLPGAEKARTDLRVALAAGEKPGADVIDRLILPLVDAAVPEWRATLDAALALPEIGRSLLGDRETAESPEPPADVPPRPRGDPVGPGAPPRPRARRPRLRAAAHRLRPRALT